MQPELGGTERSFPNMLTEITETCTGSYKLPEYFLYKIARRDAERWKESLETTILFQFREGMERKQFQTSIELKGFEFEEYGISCFTKECDRDRVDPFSTAIAHLMLGSGDVIVFDYLGEGQLSLSVEFIELPASIDMLVLSRAIELSRPDFVLILPFF